MNQKLTFYNVFEGKSTMFYLFLGFMGIIDSLWSSALLFLINHKIAGTPLPLFGEYDWQIYVVLLVVSFTVSAYFQSYLFKLTYNFGKKLVLDIFNRLRFSSFESYKKLGEERVRTAMEDVKLLESFPTMFLAFFKSAVTVLIGIIYLIWIDWVGSIFVIGILLILMVVYIIRNAKIEQHMEEARTLNDVYMKNVYDFLGGFKQLKMSQKRNDNLFYNYLTTNREHYVSAQLKAMLKALGNELAGSYSFYIIIGTILFLLPALLNTSLQTNTVFITTLLFIMSPIGAVVGLLKTFIMVGVSINRLNEFNETLTDSSNIALGHGERPDIDSTFKSIRFEEVTYEYLNDKGEVTFQLQPLNFSIHRGDVIFITGGNGSGKSTFINLLSGLTSQKSGEIYLNDYRITSETLPYYRDQLSAIFTDHYLFTENYDEFDLASANGSFGQLVETMQLTNVLRLDKENNKLDHNLSQGQRKRVALVYAMLEDKDIFIFDEWAAEQDPEFRAYFYNSIIPALKQKGKTVIAITHDDAYFHVADRLVKFDYGRLLEDEQVNHSLMQ
ncbi:MAG: ATP-binding cassette domain-containing protein [Flammeovirgaceae bacterium]